MKKFFIVALAALGFVACSDENLDDVNGGYSGEVETSYIAINLSAADNGTRANDGIYQEGLAAERAVKTAYFFFFDGEGNAFPVTATADGDSQGGTVNWISANLTDIGQEMPNVSDVQAAVLILKKYVGTYPNQIVAVLNWVPENGKAYALSELYSATNVLNTFDEINYFVMSNAVYSDGSQAIVGTPLTASDIYKDETNAKANPITIHVERIAAKVTVTTNDVANNRFPVNKNITIGGAAKAVYVQVTGWALHNDFAESKLLKDINPTWDPDALGFTWNDSPWYRCYWANSLAFDKITDNDFPQTLPYVLGSATKVNNGTYDANTYTYVGENTLYDGIGTDDCTKVILKAQLQNEDGTALSLARWYATSYAGEEDLLKAVANTIKYQYYYISEYDGTQPRKYTTIGPDDLMTVPDGNRAKFQLSTAAGVGANRADGFYVKANDNSGTYESITDDALNAALAGIEKAVYYAGGETLYYVDIKHLGQSDKLGEFGVVRNHIYNVVLKSFGGFGSPVYDPESEPIEYPMTPDEDESGYVSAEVRVLSWRLVTQEVNVQPQQ